MLSTPPKTRRTYPSTTCAFVKPDTSPLPSLHSANHARTACRTVVLAGIVMDGAGVPDVTDGRGAGDDAGLFRRGRDGGLAHRSLSGRLTRGLLFGPFAPGHLGLIGIRRRDRVRASPES